MKKIKKEKNLHANTYYIVFVGYDYSRSGFDIAEYNGDAFELSNGDEKKFDDVQVYELPIAE
jgi:hypothetical protein